ncbi:transposase family protein [Burkholderia cepacia]|uniref:transposase family protein n=1 Tax=Burkholderia cepacia TaxID=292 RepID=UPI001E35DED3|nr:transposase family protein [Burkholderia cepacia]
MAGSRSGSGANRSSTGCVDTCPWKRGIPSHDTFGRVFAALDPLEFEASFVRWKRGLCPALADEVVAIDDKSVRGSRGTNQRGPIWYRHEPASCQVICLTRKSTRLRRCSVTSTTWPTRHFQSIALNLTARFRPIVRRCAAPSIGACAKQDRPVVAANTAPPSFPTFHHPAAPHPAIFFCRGVSLERRHLRSFRGIWRVPLRAPRICAELPPDKALRCL